MTHLKAAKITKKVILPTSTSPECQCAAKYIVIFADFTCVTSR